MTDIQIENWRKVIFRMLEDQCEGAGAYALIMPKEKIEEFRDMIQENANNIKIDGDEGCE